MNLSEFGAPREEHTTESMPKVSVATITYNHEAFIGDAIDGVLLQDVDFPIEMVIGEDCSSDGTRDVIHRYMEQHPALFRLSEYKQNVGAGENFRTTIGRCRGEYIALLDGDDYWTSPDKLRKQVELMDAHPEFSMCCHAVNQVYEEASQPSTVLHPAGRQSVYRLTDLYDWIGIATSSILFRHSALPDFPPWFPEVYFGDWALLVVLADEGDIGCLADVMGAYRQHGGSIWYGQQPERSKALNTKLQALARFRNHVGKERELPFVLSEYRSQYELVHAYLDEGDPAKARKALRAAEGSRGYDPRVELLEPILSLLHLNTPRLYRWLRLDAVYLNRFLRRNWLRIVNLLRTVTAVLVSTGKKG